MDTPIALPSGTGDCLWAIGKLMHAGPLHYEVADGWPHRTVPWFELLGPEIVASVRYGDFSYSDIVTFESVHGLDQPGVRWGEITRTGPWGRLFLEPNQHLERGRPLADWLPDLPTSYHVPMHPTREDGRRAEQWLREMPRPITAVSAASYRGSEAWKTWGYDEWSPFLRRLRAETGGTILLLGGFWDDLTARIAEQDGYPDLVGKTSMSALVAVLRRCEQVVGFSSGLGMLHACDWGRTFLLWPQHQELLSRSWADPAMLEVGTYDCCLWDDPDRVWWRVRRWLKTATAPEREAIQR